MVVKEHAASSHHTAGALGGCWCAVVCWTTRSGCCGTAAKCHQCRCRRTWRFHELLMMVPSAVGGCTSMADGGFKQQLVMVLSAAGTGWQRHPVFARQWYLPAHSMLHAIMLFMPGTCVLLRLCLSWTCYSQGMWSNSWLRKKSAGLRTCNPAGVYRGRAARAVQSHCSGCA
jgi:hypothetical protein